MKTRLIELLTKEPYTLSNDEYEALILDSRQHQEGIDGELWGRVILRAFEEKNNKEGRMKALDLIHESYKEMDRIFPQSFRVKSSLLKTECLFCLREKDYMGAQNAMNQYLYNAMAQVHYNAINGKMPYYSFRKVSDYSLEDIENETISLAHPREFNDPLDTIMIYWLNEEIKKHHADKQELEFRLLMKKVSEHIKLRCLIAGYDEKGEAIPVEDLNVLMWAHYADSHKGFCVKYEFNDEMFSRIKNDKSKKIVFVNRIDYVDSINIDDEPSIKMALLEKSAFWDYEKEMRLISFDYSGKDKEFPVIKCKGAAKAIYLGANCSDSDRRKIEKAIGDKNIPLYEMSIDETKLTRFKATQIG